jgi:hypothetical protein
VVAVAVAAAAFATKSGVVTATGVVAVGGQRGSISGRVVVHCP